MGGGGKSALEGGACTNPDDCAARNSSCIFAWTNGTMLTTGGFCAVDLLPDLAPCITRDDCFSGDCKEVPGAAAGLLCAPGEGAPCSRNDQCASFCRRPFCV